MLDQRVTELLRNVLIISGLLCSGFIVFESLPLARFILTGQRTMVTAVQLPFFNPETNIGYIVNVINQTILSHFIVFCNVGHDCTLAMIINSMWAGADVIKFSIEEMVQRHSITGNDADQKRRFRNVLMQIQDLDRYGSALAHNISSPVAVSG